MSKKRKSKPKVEVPDVPKPDYDKTQEEVRQQDKGPTEGQGPVAPDSGTTAG